MILGSSVEKIGHSPRRLMTDQFLQGSFCRKDVNPTEIVVIDSEVFTLYELCRVIVYNIFLEMYSHKI